MNWERFWRKAEQWFCSLFKAWRLSSGNCLDGEKLFWLSHLMESILPGSSDMREMDFAERLQGATEKARSKIEGIEEREKGSSCNAVEGFGFFKG